MKNLLLLALFTISTISATAQLSSTSQFVRKNLDEQYLQIRTKAGKNKYGSYTPMKINGHQLKDKYMAFYFKKNFLNCFI